jgi:zinc protease
MPFLLPRARRGALLAAAVAAAPAAAAAQAPPPAAAPAAPAPNAAPARAADRAAPRVVALDNGLQVVVAERPGVPLATATLVLRAGAMTQTADDQGVPHLFEHMLFKGYRGAGGRDFGSVAAELRAGYNGTTGEELVTYYLNGPSDAALRGLELLAGLVREPRFDADELRTERFVVLGEMQRGASDPSDRLRREVARALWGGGWHRKNTIGEPTALLGVTPARLREIYGRYYVPNNAALVVTGDVSADRVVEAARRHFGPWRRRPDPFAGAPVPEPPPLAASRVVVVPGPVEAVTVTVAWQGPSAVRDRAATHAADVFAEVVNDDESDMTRRLVDRGLFQSASFGYQSLAHTGPVTFTGTTTVDGLPAALTALSVELDQMRDDAYFAAPALAAAAKRRRVEAALEAEAGPALAHTLGYWWGVAGLDYHAGYAAGLAAQTPDSLRRFVGRYLAHRPFVVGALVPPRAEAAARAMLDQFVEFSQPEPAPVPAQAAGARPTGVTP